jgi:hypothetical protein
LIIFCSIAIREVGNACLLTLGIPLLLWLTYMCLNEAKPFWEDLKHDEARTASGVLHKHVTVVAAGKGSRTAYCTIRVGGEVFQISPAVYDHIIQEDVYRIYYAPATKMVLNIEPLRESF